MSDLDRIYVSVWAKSGPGSWAYPPTVQCIDSGGIPSLHPVVPLRIALGDHGYTPAEAPEGFADLLFNGVVVDGANPDTGQYRIGKRYVDMEGEPGACLAFVCLDFDRTAHKTGIWPTSDAAQAACDALAAYGLVTKASPAGLHAFVRCPEPVPLAVATAYVRAVRDHYTDLLSTVLKTHGLKPADPLDWQQGLRIGRCVRNDGKTGPWGIGRPPMNLSAADEGTDDWVATFRPSLGSLQPQRAHRWEPTGDMPEPWPQPPEGWTSWVRATDSLTSETIAALDRGIPVTEPGDRDAPALRLVASLAAQLRTRVSREQLFGILAPSIAADDPSTLDKVWRHISTYHEGIRRSPDGTTQLTPDGRPYVWKVGAQRGWQVSQPDGTHLEVASETLVSELERSWPELELRNEKGKPHSPDTINARFGRTARLVVYDHGADHDRFDFDMLTYYVGIRTPTIEPQYDAECAEFLALYGDRFLDWVAVFNERKYPCAACVLKGRHSNGKGMIVAALRILAGGHCSLREALHPNFQQARIRPGGWFIVQNEKSSTPNNPDDIKQLIDDETHDIQIKKKDSAMVRGYTRMLVTSNKPDPYNMISAMSTDEDDIAVGLRMLVIDIPDSDVEDPRQPGTMLGVPAAWLHKRGGRSYTDDWVGTPEAPGRLVRHLASVMRDRMVQRGERLLVEGDTANWRASEARKANGNAKILDGLVLGLVAGKPLGERREDGLYLSVAAYRDSWDAIHKDKAVTPSLRAIGDALTQCGIPRAAHIPANVDPKRPLRRYIAADVLVERCADLGVDAEAIRDILSGRKPLDSGARLGQVFGNRPRV